MQNASKYLCCQLINEIKVQGSVFKCLVLSDKQSKPKDIQFSETEKTAKPHY